MRRKGKEEAQIARLPLTPLIPAKAGIQVFSPKLFVQIPPARIKPLNQPDLPGAVPLLDPPFAPKGILTALVGFVPDQAMHAISSGEALPDFFLMLPNSSDQAVG
jgi:hypothetical protein